eukprot:TRINITY_DN35764_c0_g1_i1.p1 TRINITY_DN35764_c0_g1~~TRINITY_DN35764_c0_g1_i1.p1  ORF type:complete len:642 (-),score=92.34 TRINITY_DN35764_c0_g1_i1:192-1889(-)
MSCSSSGSPGATKSSAISAAFKSFSLATSVRIRSKDIGVSGINKNIDSHTSEDVFHNRESWHQGMISLASGGKVNSYGPFHSILPPYCTQEYTHERVMRPMIDSFMNGKMNCTVFAYGQTGSGKTHTLLGPPRFFEKPASEWGLCPRTGAEILERAAALGGSWDLRCSAVEVYFDDCYDLLNQKLRVTISGFGKNKKAGATNVDPNNVQRDENGKWIPPFQMGENGAFNLRKNATEDYATQGTTERTIKAMSDFLEVMQIVESTRSAKSHALNDRSSRSHCVITMVLTQLSGKSSQTYRFLFVDLAGSERINKTGVTDTAADEAKNINTSLSSLGRVIEALRKNSKSAFIPWRDSALTMLMKQSLSGNCNTSLVVTVNESSEMVGETQSTLRFGQTCGSLQNKVKSAEKVNTGDKVSSLRQSLTEIDAQLAEMRMKGMHGALNEEEAKPTRDAFLENYKKLQKCTRDIATALKNGESKNSQKMQDLKFSEQTIRELVIRMIEKGGHGNPIWREPKPLYVSKMRERQGILTELARFEPCVLMEVAQPSLLEDMSWRCTIEGLYKNS